MDSILLPFAKVHTGSRLLKTIVGENAEIMSHCIVGTWGRIDPDYEEITVIEDHHIVTEWSIIEEGKNVNWPRAI